MKRIEYLRKAQEAFDTGKVSEEVYDNMIMNVDIFCDEEEANHFAGLWRAEGREVHLKEMY